MFLGVCVSILCVTATCRISGLGHGPDVRYPAAAKDTGRDTFDVRQLLGDPEVTANMYCKSRNLPNTETENYSTDLR